MKTSFQLGEIHVELEKKNIKNIHLSVYPPDGAVRVSAPSRMTTDRIRIFTIQKLDWIKRQQRKLQAQEREMPRDYKNKESHYLWGKRYLMKIVKSEGGDHLTLDHKHITLHMAETATEVKKAALLEKHYRDELRESAQRMINLWVEKIGVELDRFYIQGMKTKWGSCSPHNKSIRLNLELAKKPPECLEYIVVHELIHLIEPTHNDRFIALLERHMPLWRHHRDELNRLPVKHESWKY